MRTLEQVKELTGTMIANDITSLEVKRKDYAVRLVRELGATSAMADASGLRTLSAKALSPGTGSFYPRGGDDGFSDLKSGAQILVGEPLGYVGIGPVRLLCVSPASGRLVGPLPTQGETVSTGDPLFIVEFRK